MMKMSFPSFEDFLEKRERICVVGLGYVGIHVAVNFGKYFRAIGYDRNSRRIDELKKGIDSTREFTPDEIREADIHFTDDPAEISQARLIVVAVPTPVTLNKTPDLSFLISASETVGKNMREGSYIVFESTVYPGTTEEVCIPILERCSGMRAGVHFKVGYSPERVNPGDKEHTFDKVVKVVSGQDKQTADFLAKIYGVPVKAGIHVAPDIKTAEAAKVIENIQRDLNIALMNELSIIFHIMGIDTKHVLEAAGTKWNFLKFEPGLVGGHCISVDPYYLTFKAEELGYHPEVILAGRRINDYMGKYVAENTVKLMIKAGKQVKGAKTLIMGITFKENIADIRESRVVDIWKELTDYGVSVDVVDPYAYESEVEREFGIKLMNGNIRNWEEIKKMIEGDRKKRDERIRGEKKYDAVLVAVKHNVFRELSPSFFKRIMTEENPILVDVKGIYSKEEFEKEGFIYWRL